MYLDHQQILTREVAALRSVFVILGVVAAVCSSPKFKLLFVFEALFLI